LASSGLLAVAEDGGAPSDQLVVTVEAVDRVARERKVRPALLEASCMIPLDED
jgi:hypothetical protein